MQSESARGSRACKLGSSDILAWVLAAILVVCAAETTVSVQEPLLLGPQSVTGSLGGEPESWEIEGTGGQVISVAVSSSDFDPVVELLGPSGEQLADDDDGGPGLDSFLVAALPSDGRYQIQVASYGDDTGDYRLEIRRLTVRDLVMRQFASDQLDQVASAEATVDDDVVWKLRANEDDLAVIVSAESETFDPGLRLLAPDGGGTFAEAGPRQASHWAVSLSDAGDYYLLVSSADDGTGSYTVRAGIPTDVHDGGWEFEGKAGQLVGIVVQSGDFNPVVRILTSAEEEIARDSGAGSIGIGSEEASLAVVLGKDDDYHVAVFGGVGLYSLTVRNVPVADLSLGEQKSGQLGSDGLSIGVWKFSGEEGDDVTVSAGSDDFDVVLALFSGVGNQSTVGADFVLDEANELASDDDSGPGTDASLTVTLPRTGEYFVHVTAFSDGAGEYHLEVDREQEQGGEFRRLNVEQQVTGRRR